jgi:hypothetical protein
MSFKRLDPEDISISAESVVAPLWSVGEKYLTTFFTSSAQVASSTGDFFYEVYENDTDLAVPFHVQFAITYGHKEGKGAAPYASSGNIVDGKSPSSTIYGQYRNLIFGDEEVDFMFGNVASDDIYVINLDRARYKEKLLPGSFNLKLKQGSNIIELTDNSNDSTTVSYVDAGRVYDIVSGSDGSAYSGTGFSSDNGSYGKFLPDVGVVVLNSKALQAPASEEGIALPSNHTDNGAGTSNIQYFFDTIRFGASSSLQSEETISSNYVFVRVRNSEFNYSTNPSNITSSGELRHDIMINTPQAYITTVGMYNDNNDLVGVAKLSRPLLKDFTKEALIRIKLDY